MSDLGYLLTLLFGLATGVEMINDKLQHAIGLGIIGICAILLVEYLYKRMPAITEIPSIKFSLPSFFIRKFFRRHLRPLNKFKLWLDGRADEGMKIYKSNLPDSPTRNVIGESRPDHETHREFNKAYGQWRDEVTSGLKIVCGAQTASILFPSRITDAEVIAAFVYGGGKRLLIKEIESLGVQKYLSKTSWLTEEFKNDSDVLEEYETFKFQRELSI